MCWCYLWFLVQFSKSACNNLERSEIIWKVREKIQKPMGNGFIDSSASYFASEHKKYTTSLMVYIGLGFKTRQRRQTVRKQWFCLLLRPLNSNPKPSEFFSKWLLRWFLINHFNWWFFSEPILDLRFLVEFNGWKPKTIAKLTSKQYFL